MKFKVGDKVRHKKYGVGRIIRIDCEDDGTPYFVTMEDRLDWWCTENNLELVEEENMTYKEFEEIVNDWGFSFSGKTSVFTKQNEIMATISSKEVGLISTNYIEFRKTCNSTKGKLLHALVKLSLTPLDKREEVKELTVDEISELLGYKVKIKGEK